jgi:N-acetylgalactosamine-6-sulfatase
MHPVRTFALLVLTAALLCGQASGPPNIIFLLADDLGWGDLPSFGHANIVAHGGWTVRGELKMPHTDRLAREGARFTQYYVASAVCSPSRAAIMTGQFPARHGIHDYIATPEQNRRHGVADSLDPNVANLPRTLKQAGYATAHFGKWHLSSGPNAPKPEDYGIDRYDACMRGGRDRVNSSRNIADQTIAFIDLNRARPFFINAWLYDPHSPLQPTDEMMAPYPRLSTGWPGHRGAMEIYYGVLTDMDRHIGRILDHLDQLGLANNTIILFSSDNGPESGLIPFTSHYGVASTAGPFRGLKRSLYEGGIRSPLIVRWPGRIPAARVDNNTTLAAVDFLPTLAKLAGATLPARHKPDGEDLSDALLARPHARRTKLMWENRFPVYGHLLDQSPMLAVREGKWKLLLNPDRSRLELYDIPSDPTEMNNLAKAQPDTVKRLSQAVLAWQATLPKGHIDPMAGKAHYPWPK